MANEQRGASPAIRTRDTASNRPRPLIWGGAGLLLLLPAVAMLFTREVAWDTADFAIFGVMLVAACGAYELAARLTVNVASARRTRTAMGVAIVAAFLLIWVELAVGIFD